MVQLHYPLMKDDNVVLVKSFAFSVRIVRLYQWLKTEKNEHVLSRQVLRSGTSIGANIEEAVGGISKKEFAAKMGVAYKEARETCYWIRLLHATDYVDEKMCTSLLADAEELRRILAAIVKSSREKPE